MERTRKRRHNDGDVHTSKFRRNDDDNVHLQHLEQIVENTRAKSGFQLIVSGVDSKIVTTFEQPIKLNSFNQYEVAFLNLETYYSFPNINETNNCLRFRKNETSDWKMIEIPKGSYEIKAINEVVKQHVAGDKAKPPIIFKANLNTMKCILCIKEKYEVDFNVPNSIRTVLGFDAKIYKEGSHSSEHSVNILKVNSILVHIDIITSTYLDGKMEPIIYSFFPNVSPGEKIIAVQKNLIYAPVTTDTIYRMTTWLTDQNNSKLDLRGETVTIRFHLREC